MRASRTTSWDRRRGAGATRRRRGLRGLLAGGLVFGLAAAGVAAGAAPAAAAPAKPTVFTTPGPCKNFYTVPADTTRLRVVLVGGQGAGGIGNNLGTTSGGSGGRGAQLTAELPVRPGAQLNVTVGDKGVDPRTAAGQQGTFLGGAKGGIETVGGLHAESFGGQGGGASVIDTQLGCGSPQPGDVLAVAGGGGGGGGGGTFKGGGGGGDAGARVTATNGGAGAGLLFFGEGGGGATATAGGSGGGGGNASGQSGGPLSGGAGGARTLPANTGMFDGGGGGGGGWFGGGGGGEGGGGGAGGGGAGSSVALRGGQVSSIVPTAGKSMVSITPIPGAPDAPRAVSAVAGLNQATVSFSPPSTDGGAKIKFYTVTAKSNVPGFDQTVTTPGSPVTVTNLTPGASYTVTVTATNKLGTGIASAPSNAVVPFRLPGAPVITNATPGNGRATVTFTPGPQDQMAPPGQPGLPGPNPITSYNVTARLGVNVTTGPGVTATGGIAPGTANTPAGPITVTGLTNGLNYTVTVTATNAAGTGPQSAPQVVFPQSLPGAPTGVTATNATPVGASTGTVALTFTPPADTGGRPVLNYTATSSPDGITATAAAGSGSIPVTGLTLGTSYTFTVHATTATGSGPESAPSNAVTPTPVGIPSPPLTPSAATLDQAAYVSCSPPFSDGGSPIVSYTVTSSPDGITATDTSCPILVTGLTDGTTYTFTVTATNADGGTSQPSQPTVPITPHVPSGPPPANDDFANAQPISGASGSVSGTNVGATIEPGEPNIQDGEGASVWYRWTAPATGEAVRFDTCSANPAVVGRIGAFIGGSLANLTFFGPGGPSSTSCPAGQAGSTIVFNAPAGAVFSIKFVGIRLTPTQPSEGPFTLQWAPQP